MHYNITMQLGNSTSELSPGLNVPQISELQNYLVLWLENQILMAQNYLLDF